MPQHFPILAVIIFLTFTGFTLGLSFWLGRKAKSASGYFAAHGQVGWFVNGVAFAGDYLSAASFLGICGLIAFYGYDGFLYSIGFLAGWVVAMFVIAEPIKKLGKYTFADALSARFGKSPAITLAAAFSTLVVSIIYLIPQMVGAGALLKALLGLQTTLWHGIDLSHAVGVVVVGSVVIMIVVTAGMVSTTWVQFIKGSMLVIFCTVLVVAILARGIHVNLDKANVPGIAATGSFDIKSNLPPTGGLISSVNTDDHQTDALGPAQFLHVLHDSTTVKWKNDSTDKSIWHGSNVKGSDMLIPGGYFTGIRAPELSKKLDFISLMLALFCGTASLPHILIRYYTVKDASAARKSTVVGIIAIGFFYILTLYIGLGAMVGGAMPAEFKDSNMVAPMLAKTFGETPFALITAIAFTTVLGTVSGLILAGSGAVAHDVIETVLGHQLTDHAKVRAAKFASIVIGLIAIVLGILFKDFNVSFLVGWAFNVAASANLPSIIMLLFWRGTTRHGMVCSIVIGTLSSLTWLLLTKEACQFIYGLKDHPGIVPFSQPGIVTIPLSFLILVVVSLGTRRSHIAKVA